VASGLGKLHERPELVVNGDVRLGAVVVLEDASVSSGAVELTGSPVPSSGVLADVDVTITGPVSVGDAAAFQVNDLVIDASGTLDLSPGGRVDATVVNNDGTIVFGNAAGVLATQSLTTSGTIELRGAGTLELNGTDAVLTATGGTVFSAAPNNHRVVVDNGSNLATTVELLGPLSLDTLVVGGQAFTANGGTLQVGKLELDPDASTSGVVATTCTGLDGNNQGNCPPPP
jgi:hypothetical protein